MRVAESSKFLMANAELKSASSKVRELAGRVASGKRVAKPSDDPVAFVQAERLKNALENSRNTRANLHFSRLWLNQADRNVEAMADLLNEIKIKAVNAANSYVSPEQLSTLGGEIEIMTGQLLSLANSKIEKTHLFSGSDTFGEPLRENSPDRPATVFFPYPRFKSEEGFAVAELDLPLKNVPPGEALVFRYREAETGQAREVAVPVHENETPKEVISRVNERMAAEYVMTRDPRSPTEFRQDLFLYHAKDGHLYLDLNEGIAVESMRIPPSLAGVFALVKEENPYGSDRDVAVEAKLYEEGSSPFGETFSGFSEHDFIVKIVEPGKLGQAKYVVSDDAGKTWGIPQILTLKNEIVSQNSLKGNELLLTFEEEAVDATFTHNLEFRSKALPVVAYQGNDEPRRVPINDGDVVRINVTAKELFFKTSENTVNVFDALFQLRQRIDRGDYEQISKIVGDLDVAIGQVLTRRSAIGAALNKLDRFEERAEKSEIFETRRLSELEDLDMPAAISELKQKEAHNEVALGATSKILQPGLVNFLR